MAGDRGRVAVDQGRGQKTYNRRLCLKYHFNTHVPEKHIVGSQGVGKHALASALVSVSCDFALQVRVSSSLPLPAEKDSSRPRIDFIVFMIDLANRQSLRVVEKALGHVSVDYFLGKTCFITVDSGSTTSHYISSDTVTELADNHSSALLHASLQARESVAAAAERLCGMVRIAAGFTPGVTSLLIDSTRVPFSL